MKKIFFNVIDLVISGCKIQPKTLYIAVLLICTLLFSCKKDEINDQSFGITIGILNGKFSFGPYLPTTFEVKDIDMFGAAFFEGYWRGVGFYK